MDPPFSRPIVDIIRSLRPRKVVARPRYKLAIVVPAHYKSAIVAPTHYDSVVVAASGNNCIPEELRGLRPQGLAAFCRVWRVGGVGVWQPQLA